MLLRLTTVVEVTACLQISLFTPEDSLTRDPLKNSHIYDYEILQAGIRTRVVVVTLQTAFPRIIAVAIGLLSTLTVAGAVLAFHQLPI